MFIKKAVNVSRAACLFTSIPVLNCIAFNVAAQEPVKQVETITVVAQALKVSTPAQETPRTVSIVSNEELQTRAPKKLDEALRYTSGVTAQPYGADNDTDWFKVRGFDAATYLDGNRLFRDGYYTWLVEPYSLNHVEVVKGPSAILYGESAPGGVVNAVQKKPTDTPQGEVSLIVGNKNHKSIGFDISDDANDSGNIRYRLVGLMNSQDGELDKTNSDRFYLAPSIEFDISEDTALTILSSYLKDDGIPTNPFFPAAGTIVDSNYGSIDRSTNLGQPDYDKYERTQFSLGYLLEHQLNNNWKLSQKLNYGYNKLFLRSSYVFPNNNPSQQDLTQGIVYRNGKNQSITLDNHAIGHWIGQNKEQTLLVGVDLQHHETDGVEQDNYSFGSINPFNPVYGNYTPLKDSDNIHRDIKKSQASVYSQYQLKLQQQWVGMLGARYDWVKTKNVGVGANVNQDKSRHDGELSLNAGLMFLANNGLSPYINYSQSFEVLSTIDSTTGELYKPLKGEQVEAGIKYEPSFYDGYINLAWFNINQKNALVTNPATWVATQTGEVTSQGIEFESVSQLTDTVKLSANYTFTHAQTDDTSNQGKQQIALIPKHQATAWIDYSAQAWIPGLDVATGIRYIGESKDNPKSSDLTVSSVTLWDASASYNINAQWQAQLNVNNILDKEYISGCDYYCYYGQSRSVTLNAKYLW